MAWVKNSSSRLTQVSTSHSVCDYIKLSIRGNVTLPWNTHSCPTQVSHCIEHSTGGEVTLSACFLQMGNPFSLVTYHKSRLSKLWTAGLSSTDPTILRFLALDEEIHISCSCSKILSFSTSYPNDSFAFLSSDAYSRISYSVQLYEIHSAVIAVA